MLTAAVKYLRKRHIPILYNMQSHSFGGPLGWKGVEHAQLQK
jgi:hypothetical protein